MMVSSVFPCFLAIISSFLPLEPFVVSFVETMYTVLESRGHVEVCVHVTSPKDLYDGIILVEVYDFSSSTYIPSNAELAGKYIVYFSSAKYLIGRLYILSSS